MADVKVRVTLDTVGAKRDAQSLARDLGKAMEGEGRKARGFGFASAMGASAGLYRFFYGDVLSKAGTEIQGVGNVIGRASPAGQTADAFYSRLGAKRTAAEQTQEFFGMSGTKATKEQILGVYKTLRNLNELEAGGKSRVGSIIAEARVAEEGKSVADDLEFAAKHLSDVARELLNVFKGKR